ncbi:MAG TPA: fumarylacetoacetate hydrolase family protein [Cellvibrionaceae bacterium]
MNHRLPFSNQPGDFCVERIICVGRNYAEHAREMGHNPDKSTPFFFFKPPTALLPPGEDFIYPAFSHEVHHELELVVAITQPGRAINANQAEKLIGGFGVGLDMTCRDLQREAKAAGRPWDSGNLYTSRDGVWPSALFEIKAMFCRHTGGLSKKH